jgi:glyoxylase-like metal-dependent hydrolase (beta-lactamase superfamily II)
MNRKGAVVGVLAIAAGAVLAVAARADKEEEKSPISQRPWSQIELKVDKLGGNVSVVYGEGGNIGILAGDDGALVVDSQFAALSHKLKAAVDKLAPKGMRALVNTHWHFDHTGGNAAIGEHGVTILAHDNVRPRMEKGANGRFGVIPPAKHEALPIVTYSDGVTLHLNGEEVHVFHVQPAHTDGDSIVQFKHANVIHMGDCWMTISYPFVDTASGGRFSGYIDAADKVLALADDNTKIIPGHGPASDKKGLQAWRDMLAAILAKVKEQAAAGKSLADIQAMGLTKEWDARWGQAFIKPDVVVAEAYEDAK